MFLLFNILRGNSSCIGTKDGTVFMDNVNGKAMICFEKCFYPYIKSEVLSLKPRLLIYEFNKIFQDKYCIYLNNVKIKELKIPYEINLFIGNIIPNKPTKSILLEFMIFNKLLTDKNREDIKNLFLENYPDLT